MDVAIKWIKRERTANPEVYIGTLSDDRKFYAKCKAGAANLFIDNKKVSTIFYDDVLQSWLNDGDIEKLFEQVGIEYNK